VIDASQCGHAHNIIYYEKVCGQTAQTQKQLITFKYFFYMYTQI